MHPLQESLHLDVHFAPETSRNRCSRGLLFSLSRDLAGAARYWSRRNSTPAPPRSGAPPGAESPPPRHDRSDLPENIRTPPASRPHRRRRGRTKKSTPFSDCQGGIIAARKIGVLVGYLGNRHRPLRAPPYLRRHFGKQCLKPIRVYHIQVTHSSPSYFKNAQPNKSRFDPGYGLGIVCSSRTSTPCGGRS